ncbi:MAG: SDR family oxidoreductase [Acidimicrobiia bacterium]|nr:SDR family oxidoreductase [Acidimicrobiia bacterium]
MTTENPFGRNGWTPDRIGSLEGKTYVITGANSGVGFEATRTFLEKGASVVMLNRNAEKSAAAIETLKQEFGANAAVSFIHMDLAVLDSVRKAAAEVLDKTSRIDALICNAAISQTATRKLTVDGFESQLGVNHMGHFLLCGLLFERVEASQGRIVVVGSNAYRMGKKKIHFEDLNFDEDYSPWHAYNQSKLAQMMFGYELQRRVEAAGKDVVVQVCHPGASRTNLISGDVSTLNKILIRFMKPFFQPAERGAWPELLCATEPEVQSETLYGPTKRAETAGPVGECDLAAHALDREAATRLWQVSEEKTGLTWSP